MLRRSAVLVILIGAVAAASIALFADVGLFDVVLARFIGSTAAANTTTAQRVMGACGALLGGLALATAAEHVRGDVLPKARRVAPFALSLVALLALNVLGFAARVYHVVLVRALWSWKAYAAGAVLALAGSVWMLASRAPRRTEALPLAVASAAGIAYGAFSGLWHCCSPLWASTGKAHLLGVLWFATLALVLGGLGRIGASYRAGVGEGLGAIVFAFVYPWHTVPWFVQCLAGGAFATALVRVTGSGWAPAVFLGLAYATHTTLPFLGVSGVALAFAALVAHAWALVLRAPPRATAS